jgi:hypothetical protein
MANPQDGDLYGGLAGLKLDGPRFEIGQGAYIQGTFAHLMAPFILAFAKGEHGKAHPGPWRSASGGLAVDIVAEIVIPASFSVPKWFDRLNAIWWLLALLRVRVSQLARIPVIASIPFHEGATAEYGAAHYWPVEVEPHRLALEPTPQRVISSDALEWIARYWISGGRLAGSSQGFYLLAQAFTDAPKVRSPALAILSLWGPLEGMFSPARSELKFRVSALIAAYLEPPGASRQLLQKHVARLYDARSAAAHGGGAEVVKELQDTYALVRRVLLTIIEAGAAPTRETLEEGLFGVR